MQMLIEMCIEIIQLLSSVQRMKTPKNGDTERARKRGRKKTKRRECNAKMLHL